VNFPITNVPRFVTRSADISELYHLQILDVTAGSGRPNTARMIPHRTGELSVKQYALKMQAEEDGEDKSTQATPVQMSRRGDVVERKGV
jgi:hypothetical protein